MSIYRSYFSKNTTLIEDNLTNNSQNPVTEIAYGTVNAEVTRFIFDINLEPLKQRISQGIINPDRISQHILHMVNTIRFDEEYLGKKTYDGITQRASSFDLELFNITEEWDEGSGYDFVYNEEAYINSSVTVGASNWYDRETDIEWDQPGAYISGSSIILGEQHFEKGNEDIIIDVTDYINLRLGLVTGTSGTTGITNSTGVGIKYVGEESLETLYRQAVAFFARKTHTAFEPHIETIYNDAISDDRNYFFLDKDNELYLYANVGANPTSITVNSVEIIDYLGESIMTISGSSIENVSLGVYKITVNIDSDSNPDAVLLTDRWNITQNGKTKSIDQEFYLISQDKYFNFTLGNRINFDNYFFTYYGIAEGEKIKDNDIRRIEIDVKQLYPNQDNNVALDVEYRLYNSQTDHHQFDIIPWTKVNRTFRGFEILLDFSWLIPQDYKLELRLMNGNTFKVKEPINFTVVSDGITTPSIPEILPVPTTTTTTTLPPTTTTTTTLPPTTTTTTTLLPNPKIYASVTSPNFPAQYTNTDNKTNSPETFELYWTTDASSHTKTQEPISNGQPLYSTVQVSFNWSPSGGTTFETIDAYQVSGMTIGTGINGPHTVTLNAGDNEGWVRFIIRDTLTSSDFEIWVDNTPDPTVELGTPADSSDSEFVSRLTAGTTYGYVELTSSIIKMYSVV